MAAPNYQFNTPADQVIDRELLVLYLNTGTAQAPEWSPVGKRVEDSSAEYDWGKETKKDILGATRTTLKKPTITQSFEPVNLDSGDAAAVKLHKLAIIDQDAAALAALDCLIVHYYVGTGTDGEFFAEHYPETAIDVKSVGGEGGGSITMPFEVTPGGDRETGKATKTGGSISFVVA